MESIYIDLRKQNDWIREIFDNKDMVSVEEMIDKIWDLSSDLEKIKDDYMDFKRDVEDNYIHVPIAQQIDISDMDFI